MGIDSIGSKYASPLLSGSKKALGHYANFVFGVEQNDVFSKALRTSTKRDGWNNFGTNVSEAWGKSSAAVKDKSLMSVIKESFSGIPKEMRATSRLVKQTGKNSKYFGATMKILGKRMPFIGNALMLATEVPNLYRSFTDKDGGIGTGVVETAKVAAKLGGFAAGAAIGQALIPIPFVGAIIGGAIGGMIVDRLVGKSFTEKKEEAQATAQNANKFTPAQAAVPQAPQQPIPQPNAQRPFVANQINPMAAQMFGQNPYAVSPFDSQMAMSPLSRDVFGTNNDIMNQDLWGMKMGYAR